MRPAGFCAHLPSLDYSPTILTADYRNVHPPITIDESLSSLVSDNLDVRLVSFVNWQKRALCVRDLLRNLTRSGSPSPTVNASPKNDDERTTGFSLKSEILNRVFRFPDQQGGWARAAVKYARSIPGNERPDIVFATANPWSGLLAGAKIAEYFNVPFVADFRDPWVDNPKPALTPSLGRKAERLEKSIVQRATRIIANTEELAASFRRRYPAESDKFDTITNGFHQYLVEKFRDLPTYQPQEEIIELCYFGSVYELRKPTILLEALKESIDSGQTDIERLVIRITGNWIVADPYCNRLASELEQRGALIREPIVPHQEYLARLKTSQILLILQQGFPLQIPAKIYEYMASGRPSVMIGGEGATANLYKTAGLGVVCENNKVAIKALYRSLCQSPEPLAAPKMESLAEFAYPNLTQKLVNTFAKALGQNHEKSR